MRTKTKDITNKYKNMRTSKVLDELNKAELSPEEKQVFMLRLRFYNESVSYQIGKCPRCVTKIFMRALNKLKDYLKEVTKPLS
jgi:hypothetical protein